MSGVNKVILIGNLGNDPEIKHTKSGATVANISIATSEKWKDKTTGQDVEKTEWHRIVFFGKLAEVVEKYLKKGGKVYIEGSLTTSKWQDKSGEDRYSTDVKASDMQMLDAKSDGGQQQQNNYQPQQPAPVQQNNYQPPPAQQQPVQQQAQQTQQMAPHGMDSFDGGPPF